MQILKLNLIVGMMCFLVGCDATDSRFSKYYTYQDTSPNGKPLVLSHDLSDSLLTSNSYAIPKLSSASVKRSTHVLLVPPGSNLSRFAKEKRGK